MCGFQICFCRFLPGAKITGNYSYTDAKAMYKSKRYGFFLALSAFAVFDAASSGELPSLSEVQSATAAAQYQQYCALCHGENREGYANDRAPSLRSRSLMTSGMHEMFLATAYGRRGTPMAGYIDDMGGPMTKREIFYLVLWLQSHVAVEPYTASHEVVPGDIDVGRAVYAEHCASCHGESGEGGSGTALGNSAMLSLTTDKFIRYAIEHGRDGTEMAGYSGVLSDEEIDGVTAFLRSRATGWTVEKPVMRSPPQAGNYVINPDSPTAQFDLKDDLYVMSVDLFEALQAKKRIVLLDTRSPVQWQIYHIEGSVPIPYYTTPADVGTFLKDVPDDGTMIVTYCECPRSAAKRVNTMLREQGFTNTAVLWEGIGGWVSLGYPVFRGQMKEEANIAVLESARLPNGDQ